jgi:hypothetical protein
VRTDVRRYKLLSEWIERFVPLLEEKLEKRLAVERDVSELRQKLQEDEGIDPPPLYGSKKESTRWLSRMKRGSGTPASRNRQRGKRLPTQRLGVERTGDSAAGREA